MRLDFSGYDVSVSEHCGPFRPLGMKSARQIDRICFKIKGIDDGNTFSLHSWFTPQPYFLRRLARNGSVIMDGLSAESGFGHRGDSKIFAMFKYACISWLMNSILKMHCSETAMLECWRSTKCFFKLMFRSETLTKPEFCLEFSELVGKFSGFRKYKSRSRWRSRLIPRYYPRSKSNQVTSWKSAI